MQTRFDRQLDRLTSSQGRRSGFLLALSGGADSMTMAHLLLHSPLVRGLPVVAAHANFSLRGAESDADEALVREWARDNGLPLRLKRFDTQGYAASHGCSIEMAARILRYDWFRALLEEEKLGYALTAHHLNDNAETLLLHLVRGTGLRGLSGIPPVNGPFIRPMLGFSREEIREYARTQGIPYREDASNTDCRFARNRIRCEVLPQLQRINPSLLQTLERSMHHFAQAQAVLDEGLQAVEERLCRREGGRLRIDAAALLAEPHSEYWLYRLLEPFGFNGSQLSDLYGMLEEGKSGRRLFSATHQALTGRASLTVSPLAEPADGEAISRVEIRVAPRPEGFDPAALPEGTLVADADRLTLPLTLRRWQPGDRFRPFGMRGFRKLSDFFADRKMDCLEKERQVVVTTADPETGERIVCIAGLRLDDRVRVTEATQTLVFITLSRP